MIILCPPFLINWSNLNIKSYLCFMVILKSLTLLDFDTDTKKSRINTHIGTHAWWKLINGMTTICIRISTPHTSYKEWQHMWVLIYTIYDLIKKTLMPYMSYKEWRYMWDWTDIVWVYMKFMSTWIILLLY